MFYACAVKFNVVKNIEKFFLFWIELNKALTVGYYVGVWPIFYLMINSRAHNKCYNENGLIPD